MQKANSVFLLTAALMFVVSHSQAADDAGKPPCPNDGYISARLVPTARVAKEIYRAVALGLSPNNFDKFPIVTAKDEGDHWAMSQTDNAPPPRPNQNPNQEIVIITAGGGQLNMDIDKCTGAISHAAGVR